MIGHKSVAGGEAHAVSVIEFSKGSNHCQEVGSCQVDPTRLEATWVQGGCPDKWIGGEQRLSARKPGMFAGKILLRTILHAGGTAYQIDSVKKTNQLVLPPS